MQICAIIFADKQSQVLAQKMSSGFQPESVIR
jgi:hypothetical protein